MNKEVSAKEKRIRQITRMYYSRPEIQKAIFDFCKNRETVPRFFEGFGKRPDTFQFPSEIFEVAKKGATSFHCSEEIWSDPLQIKTGMSEKEANELRDGWDLLIDIDSKYLDFSKILADQLVKALNFHGIKNIGIKFSGSKGFHLIIPWKSFPQEVNGIETKNMFPEWPRIILKYLSEKVNPSLVSEISKLTSPSKYIKDHEASKEVIPDLVLVSSRHLFRTPYSLHEKTTLASAVIDAKNVLKFDPKDANPMSIKVKNFSPISKENEAAELLMQALDWHKENFREESISPTNSSPKDFKPIKLTNLSEKNFPPSIQKILEGVSDGRKRALFILINFFRSIGIEKEELEQRIEEWNKKNEIELKKGYIKSQLIWSYRNKIVPPPNFNKDYYKGIGIVPTKEELRFKNPINFTIRKHAQENKKPSKKKSSEKKF